MQVVIIGAGGHGKVVLDILRAGGEHEAVGFLDADPALAGATVSGLPVMGSPPLLHRLRPRIAGAVIAIGDNRARLRYAETVAEAGLDLVNAVHPSAVVSPAAVLGRGVVVAATAVVCTEARIEDLVILNTGAIADHEVHVGRACHIAPGALLAGRVRVGSLAFVGMGAKVLQCLSVGEGATIGAGAVVLQDVAPHATAIGVPARIIKVNTTGSKTPPS